MYYLFLINNSQIETPKKIIDFEQVPQPPINKDFNKLIEILNQNHTSGYLNYIFCVNSQQQSRLNEIFDEISNILDGDKTKNFSDKLEDNKKNEMDIIDKIKNLETMYNNGTLNEEEFKNAILGTGFEVVKVVKSDKFIDDAGEARKLVD